MHLHSMTLQALGPFAGTYTIDFAELGASGLFLLEGPTGAGKSTIIDAVVFALYGKVASADASEDRLRSAHAAPDQETFVDLVLEVGSGVYRVRRTPRFDRPKQRGAGSTTQQASVLLWRLSRPDAPHDGELMSSRLDEAGAELQRIVGLDRSQFTQTVVLPQGEFAGFLRAKPEDRRGLLQKVFGTAVYEQLQKRLELLRSDAGRSLDEARHTVSRSGSLLVGAAALGPQDAAAVRAASEGVTTPSAADGLLDLARTLLQSLRAETLAGASAAAHAKELCTAARTALDDARALAAAATRRDSLQAELVALNEATAEHRESIDRLAAARRAAAVLPLVAGAEHAAAAVARASARVAGARAAAPTDLHELVDAFTELDLRRKSLAVERDGCTSHRATLLRLVELEAGLPARQGQIAAGEAARNGKAAERERLATERVGRPARRLTLSDELAVVTRTAAGSAAADQAAAAAQVRCVAAQDVARLTLEISAAERVLEAAAVAARHSVAWAAQVQQARIAGIAGELAAHLVPGDGCPVCGALEHPRPAVPGPDHVTVADVEAAELGRAAATASLTGASETLQSLRVALEGRRATAGADDGSDASPQARLEAAREAVGAASRAAARQLELQAELALFDLATQQLDTQVSALAAQLAAEGARLAGLRAQLSRDDAEVLAGRDGAPSVRERAQGLVRRTALVTAWIDALAEAEAAGAQQAVRSHELSSALAEHGFSSASQVTEVSLSAAEVAALDRVISQFESSYARVTDALAEPEIAALPDDVCRDLTLVEAAHAAADAQAAAAAAEAAALQQRMTAGSAALAELERAVRAYEVLERESGPVVRMANLAGGCSGDNVEQLTLPTFVLARRFQDVVAAANARLVTMSDGRYELGHSTGREDVRARKKGLALTVMDHTTGTARDPRTLSGGETFYVSLCLALGLADVVTAEAGGVDLGTLFVDEGFGSLDNSTLDVVLAGLARLRDGGRTVGVVSHVEALKQSIAERIEVRRLPDGSSTLTVRA